MTTDKPAAASQGFASVMQQLSAEAQKSTAIRNPAQSSAETGHSPESIESRLKNLEQTLTQKIDDLTRLVLQSRISDDRTQSLREIEEHLTAIRSSESVNQKLFDSLHDELLKYRDNFVHESLQKPFIHDLVHLFDDLSSLAGQLRSNTQELKKRAHVTQWRDNLENAIHALVEILHRLEVTEVEPKETVDRNLHRVMSFEPADYPEEDGVIVMRLKRGFFWRGNLIRPEEVIAKRYG